MKTSVQMKKMLYLQFFTQTHSPKGNSMQNRIMHDNYTVAGITQHDETSRKVRWKTIPSHEFFHLNIRTTRSLDKIFQKKMFITHKNCYKKITSLHMLTPHSNSLPYANITHFWFFGFLVELYEFKQILYRLYF